MMIKTRRRGYLSVQKDGKWGILEVNTNKIIIPIQYDRQIKYHYSNTFIAYQNKKYSLLDNDGKTILILEDNSEPYIELIYNGFIKITSQKEIIYIDYLKNQVKTPFTRY